MCACARVCVCVCLCEIEREGKDFLVVVLFWTILLIVRSSLDLE